MSFGDGDNVICDDKIRREILPVLAFRCSRILGPATGDVEFSTPRLMEGFSQPK